MQYLITTKKENTFSATVFVGAVTNFVLKFFPIQVFQSMGAAVALVVAETTIAIIQIYIVRKEMNRLDLTGYEVVRAQYFATLQNPAMTISEIKEAHLVTIRLA